MKHPLIADVLLFLQMWQKWSSKAEEMKPTAAAMVNEIPTGGTGSPYTLQQFSSDQAFSPSAASAAATEPKTDGDGQTPFEALTAQGQQQANQPQGQATTVYTPPIGECPSVLLPPGIVYGP